MLLYQWNPSSVLHLFSKEKKKERKKSKRIGDVIYVRQILHHPKLGEVFGPRPPFAPAFPVSCVRAPHPSGDDIHLPLSVTVVNIYCSPPPPFRFPSNSPPLLLMDPLFSSASPSSSTPKRPCPAAPAARVLPESPGSMDRLMETFLDMSISSSSAALDVSLERIVDSRLCDSEKSMVIESALRLGSILLESAKRSERKLASKHNSAAWPLPPDLTVKVLSMLDTKSQCYAAASCSLFYKLACDPLCYANIDLTSMSSKVNNSVVCTMIQRAGTNLRSLKLGTSANQGPTLSQSLSNSIVNPIDVSVLSWNDKRSRLGKESSGLTRSCLLSLSINGGAAGVLLRSLRLYNIEKMDNAALRTGLSACQSLLDLEVIGLHVELRQTLECLSTNCHFIERLFVESSKMGRDDSLKSPTCVDLVNGCPNLNSLTLRGFKLHDCKVRILVRGLRKLKLVDFSASYSITGTFLRNLGGGANCLEVLMLRDCLHLKEVEVSRYLSAVLAGDCKSLKFLDISNRDGLSAEEDWYDRCYNPSSILITRMMEERPDICLVAEFPTDRSFIEIDEIVEAEVNSDISFPSQMTPDSFFLTSSESSYNSDPGSGNEDSNDVPEAVYGGSSDEADFQFS